MFLTKKDDGLTASTLQFILVTLLTLDLLLYFICLRVNMFSPSKVKIKELFLVMRD